MKNYCNMTSFGSSSTKLCILAFLITISGHKLAFSQKQATNIFKDNRQFIGAQFNPYYKTIDQLFETDYYQGKSKVKVYAIRYGIEVPKKLYLGVDLSFYNSKNKERNERYAEIKPGLFGKYELFGKNNFSFVTELGGYYRFINLDFPELHNYPPEVLDEMKKPKPGWYAATGLGINLYKKKVTLDLMVKYSPDVLFESQHFVPTYKLNYHFN